MVVLDGDRLAIEQVIAVAVHEDTAALAPASVEKMLRSRAVVERLAAGDEPVYGVNTGVGLLADVRVPPADLEQLQRNVVRSHAAGAGDPLEREEVRAMMLIRANVLAKGFSGIRPVVAERLCQMLERGVTPVVPSQGSVGASGDLAPLAHMALVLMGEGEAEFAGARMPGARSPAACRYRAARARVQRRHLAPQRYASHARHWLPGTGRGGSAHRYRRGGVRPHAGRFARNAARF